VARQGRDRSLGASFGDQIYDLAGNDSCHGERSDRAPGQICSPPQQGKSIEMNWIEQVAEFISY